MASREPEPIFIDFEGIDGSGKTTLSNRLAAYLTEQGIPVHHARDKGIFRSEISKEIRNLTRDPRFLRMSDVTELLLYVARDTQSIDEFIRPKLLPGNICFCDRYLYSTTTHSHFARGLPRDQVEGVLELAARGLWPDLVVYCDVDPLTSRVRKKIQKIHDKRLGDFGRKGLMGIGFREKMREGFLTLAAEDPDRWLVIDNANSTIEESLQRIFDRVAKVLKEKGYGELKNPRWADLGAAPTEKKGDALQNQVRELLTIEDAAERRAASRPVFFDELDRLAGINPGYAAIFCSGLDTPEANAVRERVIEAQGAVVAYGLQGLKSPESMAFRQRLKDSEPEYVARSLSGMSELIPGSVELRRELATVVPRYVALSVRGKDTEHAWEIRQALKKEARREVILSLRGIDNEQAWKWREKWAKNPHYPALLESLGGLDTERAWEWRDSLSEAYLPWVLLSLRDVYSDRAWDLRQEHVERAPKIIIKTIGRSVDPRAWELREKSKFYAKEVLDSLSGLDSGPAWSLRMDLTEKWPNTTVSSLGAGVQSERAWNFRWEMLGKYPDNHLLLKHIVKAALRAESDASDYDEDEDGDGDL